ncbi:hypothetical protein BJ878DRAFT_75191 [Calycina marina]|uniref:Uncharacterized protein n=1 Tax=Calycina marina TaxID=1763456 RepID=A0A9P7Z2Y0_9HELO|nr:hypothetical protein BJ878DRAFT_75191 [Calycina marina]
MFNICPSRFRLISSATLELVACLLLRILTDDFDASFLLILVFSTVRSLNSQIPTPGSGSSSGGGKEGLLAPSLHAIVALEM